MTTVLVTSGGGHLQEMLELLPRIGLDARDYVLAAPRSGLSDLRMRPGVDLVLPYLPQRDWRAALRMVVPARRYLRQCGAQRVISTGASPAPPFFLAGASLGLELHFIESAARSSGPSLSGRLIAALPQAQLYTQYPSWANGRWSFSGSIFDAYRTVPSDHPVTSPRRFVVSLGTEQYGFRRAAERLLEILPGDAQVLWQTGSTDVSGLDIEGLVSIPSDELARAIRDADVVVCHGGVGSALTAFDAGKRPLLIPRESRFSEHVDDHQVSTCAELARRGLAVATLVEDLTWEHLVEAGAGQVVRDGAPRPFPLSTRSSAQGSPRALRSRSASSTPMHADVGIDSTLAAAQGATAPEAKACFRRVLASPAATPSQRARAAEGLVDLLWLDGKHAECVDLLQQRLAMPFGSPAERLNAEMRLVRFLAEAGAGYVARESAQQFVSNAEAAGLASSLAGIQLRTTLAGLLRQQGDLISAELQISLALAAAERLDDPLARGSALWNAALISSDDGRHEEALCLARSARALLHEAGDELAAARVAVVELKILLDSGADVAVEPDGWGPILDVLRARGTASHLGLAHVQLARVHLSVGDLHEAHRQVQTALVLIGDVNPVDTAEAKAVKAQVLASLGDVLGAQERTDPELFPRPAVPSGGADPSPAAPSDTEPALLPAARQPGEQGSSVLSVRPGTAQSP